MLFGAAGKDWRDLRDSEFGRLLDGPFEVIELENGQVKVERKCSVGFQFFMQDEVDTFWRDAGDLGPMQEAGCDHIEDLAWFGAENACEVQRLVARERGVSGVPRGRGEGVGNPAATHKDRV